MRISLLKRRESTQFDSKLTALSIALLCVNVSPTRSYRIYTTTPDEGIGKSRAGNTTKIHLAVDGYGLQIDFDITGGHINDCTAAPELISKLPQANAIVADKGSDSERIREQIREQGSQAVIRIKRNSIKGNDDLDRGLYRYRHLVKNAFARLKQYRALVTRFDKLKRNYDSVVAMACAFLWLSLRNVNRP